MIHYVIADIHGQRHLLEKALAAIETMPPGTIVTLGDYIDRGPDSHGVLEILMNGASKVHDCVHLAGNHDRWFAELWRDGEPFSGSEWAHCGGDKTVKSYRGRIRPMRYGSDVHAELRRIVPKSHIEWIEGLPLYHVADGMVFVHAGVDETRTLEDQIEITLTWAVWQRNHPGGYRGMHVVHGHESTGPEFHPLRTNLDGRAWDTGKLYVGIFEDGAPQSLLEIE